MSNKITQKINKGDYSSAIKDILKKTKLRKRQQEYLELVRNNDIMFCTGPAGTAKTFTSLYSGLQVIGDSSKPMENLILSKPLVESGERLGFLPGTQEEKIEPFMESYRHNLDKIIDKTYRYCFEQSELIKYKPLAYMRGQNYDNSVMILDEAQNATFEQLMLFLTRMGEGSKVIIAGDVSQSDAKDKSSGLPQFVSIMEGLDNVGVFEYFSTDIQRHPALRGVIDRYEVYQHSNDFILE